MLVFRSWLTVISVIMFLCACSRGIENVEVKASFHEFATLKDGADERLAPLMDSLQHVEELRPFMDSAANAFGYPLWEHAVIGTQSGGLMVLAPMVRSGSSRVSGLIALKNNGKFSVRIFDAEKPGKYGYGKGLSARNVFIAADLFNQRAFDHDGAAINDPCMMSRMERAYITGARMAKPGMTVTLTAREIVGYVETCYYTTACTGDGSGNCIGEVVVQRDCILSPIWFDDTYGNETIYDGIDGSQNLGSSSSGGIPPHTQTSGGNDCYGTGSEMAVALPPPDKPVTNIAQYMGCFSSSHPAKLVFYADQPTAGSADPFSVKDKAGHAFVAVEQMINGVVYRRSVGFHPRQGVSPFFPDNTQSQLGDDSNQPFDVSLEVNITAAQLSKVLQKVNQPSPVYNLESYNCTHFVYDVAAAAGINIPKTNGWWIMGSGLNPANFGEDLKKCTGAKAQTGISSSNTGSCN
ncbi:hypothetical protein [Chitinophaga sp.]|uniref:hypothetical protein n=1 Tax=Chitinophaga sp. TaxID=1869181 RepID=UPI0031D8CA53